MQTRRALVWVSLAVLLVLAVAVPAIAQPAVTWTPAALDEVVVNASVSTTTVMFTARRDLNGVVARVVPELAEFISLELAELGDIAAGESRTLVVEISVPPESPPQILEGTIQLRHEGTPRKTYSRPLPVILTIEPIALPADPGEDGKATLEGVDADGDGLRDDIQRYIAIEYWDQPLIQAGLRQIAFGYQDTLIVAGDSVASEVLVDTLDRNSACLELLVGLEESITKENEIIAELLNTDLRSRRYIQHNSDLSGNVFSLVEATEDACNFDVGEVVQ